MSELSYAYFPHNIVEIDGKQVPAYTSSMHFTMVPIPEGEHVLTLRASLSALRKGLIALAFCTFFVSTGMMISLKGFFKKIAKSSKKRT